MKLISTKTVNGDKLEVSSKKFDIGLISYAKSESSNGIFSAKYIVNEVGNVCGFPFKVSDLTFYVKVTNANVYASAVVEFYDDEEYARYEDYSSDGMFEFDVEFSDDEKIALLAFLLNELR